jgi:TonB family protein
MVSARRSWRPEARLGAAIAASVALHLGVMPGLSSGLGGPDLGGEGPPLRARIALEKDQRRAAAERVPGSDRSTGPGPAERGLPVVRESPYFTASELDHRPVPLLPVDPRYPDGADGRVGRVVLNLFIDRDGGVDKIVLVSGDHPFDESAMWAFGLARFSPGVRRGAAVKSQMLIEITYRPEPSPTAKTPG